LIQWAPNDTWELPIRNAPVLVELTGRGRN